MFRCIVCPGRRQLRTLEWHEHPDMDRDDFFDEEDRWRDRDPDWKPDVAF